MSRPLTVTEQEEDYSFSPSADIHSIILQSERDLYPSLHYDTDPFQIEPGEDNTVSIENFEGYPNNSEETGIKPFMGTTDSEQVEGTDFLGSYTDFNSTSEPAPPSSHSNPETPTEQVEMSFEPKPEKMTRNLSEQSPLAPQTRHTNPELEVRPISQGLNQVLPSAASNPPKTRAGTPGPHSRVTSISGISTPIVRPQAGPEQKNRYEPAARFSNVRQHLGPSGLRNSISAPSEDYNRLVSSSSQQYPQPVQTYISTPSLSEQIQSQGNQNRHDFHSETPQLWAQNRHASPYKAQMHMHTKSNSTGNFTPQDQFSDLFDTNSSLNIHSSPFSEDRSHANMTQHNVNLPRYQHELLLQQAPAYLPFTNQHVPQHRRASNFEQGHFPNMNMNPEDFSSGARQSRLKYNSLEEARREKSVSTHNSPIDHTFPQSRDAECEYVERMLDAMVDMSVAEDNAGMKRTWESMMRDLDKVEKAAWEILNLCKARHLRNGPFEMSPKTLRQYDTFQDRVQTICEAMQTQKTLCKHLLRQPFTEEVVEDPIAAVSRIKNNRKVNHGKKEAIDKGREALGEKGHGKGRRTTKVVQEDTDEEFEAEDDEYGSQAGGQRPPSKKRSLSRSHPPTSRHRQTSSDDPLDQNYREGSAPKKTKRSSRSVYQLNEHNQMVDMSQPPQLKAEPSPMPRSASHHQYVDSHNPYGYQMIPGVTDARPDETLFGSSAEVDFGQHQQGRAEGRRRAPRR